MIHLPEYVRDYFHSKSFTLAVIGTVFFFSIAGNVYFANMVSTNRTSSASRAEPGDGPGRDRVDGGIDQPYAEGYGPGTTQGYASQVGSGYTNQITFNGQVISQNGQPVNQQSGQGSQGGASQGSIVGGVGYTGYTAAGQPLALGTYTASAQIPLTIVSPSGGQITLTSGSVSVGPNGTFGASGFSNNTNSGPLYNNQNSSFYSQQTWGNQGCSGFGCSPANNNPNSTVPAQSSQTVTNYGTNPPVLPGTTGATIYVPGTAGGIGAVPVWSGAVGPSNPGYAAGMVFNQYGTLVLYSDGGYSFTPASNNPSSGSNAGSGSWYPSGGDYGSGYSTGGQYSGGGGSDGGF